MMIYKRPFAYRSWHVKPPLSLTCYVDLEQSSNSCVYYDASYIPWSEHPWEIQDDGQKTYAPLHHHADDPPDSSRHHEQSVSNHANASLPPFLMNANYAHHSTLHQCTRDKLSKSYVFHPSAVEQPHIHLLSKLIAHLHPHYALFVHLYPVSIPNHARSHPQAYYITANNY